MGTTRGPTATMALWRCTGQRCTCWRGRMQDALGRAPIRQRMAWQALLVAAEPSLPPPLAQGSSS